MSIEGGTGIVLAYLLVSIGVIVAFVWAAFKGSSFIFPARYLVARDHRLPALRDVHLLVNVLHRDLLVSARSLALKREQALLTGG